LAYRRGDVIKYGDFLHRFAGRCCKYLTLSHEKLSELTSTTADHCYAANMARFRTGEPDARAPQRHAARQPARPALRAA
jgi:hypothetical protein